MSTVPSPSHSFLFFSMNSSAVSVNTISYFGYINIARNLENKTNYFTCKHFCGFLSYFFLFFWLPLLVFKYIFVCLLHGLYIHVTYIFCLILYFWKISYPQFMVSSLLPSILSLWNLQGQGSYLCLSIILLISININNLRYTDDTTLMAEN